MGWVSGPREQSLPTRGTCLSFDFENPTGERSLWLCFLPPLSDDTLTSLQQLQRLCHQGAPKWGSSLSCEALKHCPVFPCHSLLQQAGKGEGEGFLTSLPLARAKPPPSRNTIFQGIFSFTVFQLRRAGGAFSFPGFSTPQAEEGRVNRSSLPSTWGFLYGSLSELNTCRRGTPVLQHANFVPVSLVSHTNLSGLCLILPNMI